MAREGVGPAVLVELPDPWPEHHGPGKSGETTDGVHHSRAREVKHSMTKT